VLELLLLVMLDGRITYLNPREIVSVTEAKDADDPGKHYTDKVKCVVSMTDGKVFSTEETCEHIEERLREIVEKRIREMRK
jgi:ketosteroid isomerase-like protein